MKRIVMIVAFAAIVGAMAAANGTSQEAMGEEIVLPSILVEADYVLANLDADNLVLLDAGRKLEEYQSGHLKGALYADRMGYYQKVNGIPGMFPGVETAVAWLESLGISNDSAVVVYDGGNGLWAARVAWTLAYLGHENWAVLNGGYSAWEAAGGAVSGNAAETPEPGVFVPDVQEQLLVDGDTVHRGLDTPGFVVIDTRSRGEYEGSDVRADRGGHIPDALPIEWVLNNSDGPSPGFLGSEEIAEFYVSQGVAKDAAVVTHCQTGVRGAHTWLALKLADYKNVALYDGSWIEWANDEKYPVEK